jgi:hypothetical protein
LEGDHTTSARLNLLEDHKQAIKEQLQTLKDVDDMLERKVAAYKNHIINRQKECYQ